MLYLAAVFGGGRETPAEPLGDVQPTSLAKSVVDEQGARVGIGGASVNMGSFDYCVTQ